MISELIEGLRPKRRLKMLSARLLIEEDTAKKEKLRQQLEKYKVSVVSFGNEELGFCDASLPRLREVVSKLKCDCVEFFHNRVVLSFYDSSRAAQRAIDCFQRLMMEHHFDHCCIGVAVGTAATPWLELLRIARDAESNLSLQR